jgi:GTP cyclohydrolase II
MERLERWLAETATSSASPLVTLSYAQSLDGSINLRRGELLAISGAQSQQLTHKLRAAHDAILVGIGTVLADDPQLNVRLSEGEDPQIVVLDSQLRFPLDAKMLSNNKKPILFCAASASSPRQTALEKLGVRVERQTALRFIDLPKMLERLCALELNSVMAEGGAAVMHSFLAANLVDRVVITIAPMFIGGGKAIENPLAEMATNLPRLQDMDADKIGDDLVVWGRMTRSAA